MCRKWSGSAFVSYAGFAREDFAWESGEELLVRYPSSPGFERVFCGRCGSSLAGWPTEADAKTVWVMMGSLAGQFDRTPSEHIFVGSKASWFEIKDDLVQHQEFPG
jgi:hypothetical protein